MQRLEQAVADMERHQADRVRYIEADNDFHLALAEASGNSVFQLIINSIVDLLQEARRLAIAASGSAARAGFYHRRILQAIQAKDAGEAARAMQEHMSQARQEIIATLQHRSGADQGAQHDRI